ncbi:hypothetical protein MCEMAEM21_00806 [Oxalobacteraceae bacterium]
MRFILPIMLLMVGIIHILPLSGVLSAARLFELYGMTFDDPNLEILMRHRAVLFGLLGIFLICSAFMPSLQLPALIAGFLSVVSFLYLSYSVGGYNEQVNRIVIADKVALVCLVVALVSYLVKIFNTEQVTV